MCLAGLPAEAAHAGIGIEAAAVVNAMLEAQVLGGFPPHQLGGKSLK